MGLLDRLKSRLSRTRSAISDGISGLFRGGRTIDQTLLDELEELLYTSDLGPTATTVCADISRLHKRGEIKGEDDVRTALRSILLERLGEPAGEIVLAAQPTVILVVGVNGSGKTTSIAKIAKHLVDDGRSVVLGAADTFRAAADTQLRTWGDRVGVPVVSGAQG